MPRVIAHLGEDLIKDESIALLELVKNSYDAKATVCKVDFVFDVWGKLEKITVEDNGAGMDLATIENVWLVIGTDNKKRQLNKEIDGRVPLGEKGIGRLGVHKLGCRIHLFSKSSSSKEVFVDIDWRKLDDSEQINDFKVYYDYQAFDFHFDEGQTGTIIEITDLKGEWNRRKLRTVFRNLTSLNSPFKNQSDSFEVLVTTQGANPFAGLPNLEEIKNAGMYFGHCIMRGSKIEDFNYEFKPWLNLDRIDGRVVNTLDEYDRTIIHKIEEETDNNKIIKREEILDLSKYDIGQIEFDIVIFEKDNAIFNLMNLEKRALNDYLKNNCGIRVYRDNMRVFNYGEPGNDWLGIDQKRLSRAGGSVSNNVLIGSVLLQRKTSFGLREKTNREGFIEDEAFFAFVDAVRYALDIIVAQRNQDRFNLMSIYKQGKQQSSEPVIGELSEVITLIKDKVENESDQKEILTYLYRMEKQYNEVRDTLIHSANIGINLGGAVHELEKQMAALKGFIRTGDIDKIKEVAELLDIIIERYASMMVKSEIRSTDITEVVRLVIEHNLFRFKDHQIRLFSNYKSASFKVMLSKTETISALNNLIDNSIYWVSRSRQTGRKMGIYITDHITGYISVIVCDNGPGFKLPPELAVRPFVSGKPLNSGMGLGLYISQQTMHQMSGKLLIQQDDEFNIADVVKDTDLHRSVVALCFQVGE
ncbi:MAG: sensor histidine kinase [Bacteroidales bacterium]|nr:sensor histidine kinase [Bacteroidales bacterium]